MRLLLLSLQKSGAAPRDALEFSNALCELRTEHEIIISSGNELLKDFNSGQYRTVRVIPTFNSSAPSFLFWTLTLIRPVRLLFLIARYKRQGEPYTIISTHFHPWLMMLPTLATLLRFKWYHAVHENPFTDKEQRSGLSKRLEEAQARTADVIICHSEFVKTQLEGKLAHSKIIVIPLGAYASAASQVTLDPRFTNKNKPLLACIGRLEPYKGLNVLIDAFEILKTRGVSANLLIAGRGTFTEELKAKMYSLGIILENRWLTQAETTGYVVASDLIVLPYLQGSQSGMISLALAVGRPVVVTTVGGLAEQVDDNITGKLITSGNPHALADAIEQLLKNPEKLAEMGMKARVLGSSRLSWKRGGEIFLQSLTNAEK